jgi:serine/threonine protein kinase
MGAYDNDLGFIDDKYIIKKELGVGAYSIVYQVKERTNGNEYAAKVIKDYFRFDEVKISQFLSTTNCPYIINFKEFSQGDIRVGNNVDFRPYIIYELCPKGSLEKYLSHGLGGFDENQSKFIISDIAKGVHECHKKGICHLDIKAENIFLDCKFTPKLGDFGFSSFNSILEGDYGTRGYKAPEVTNDKEYDGIKADIFSLGILLLNIRTGKLLSTELKISLKENKKKTIYDLVKDKDERIWNIFEINGITGLSNDFKSLFLRMVSINPIERPSIDIILQDKWFNLSNEQRINLAEDVRKEFIDREEDLSALD